MNRHLKPQARNPERGTIVVLVAGMMVGFMAMAALAVDAGVWYETKRHMQAAADAAVMAGMPSLGSSTTAQTTAKANATSMATSCGYTSGVSPTVATVGSNLQLTVTITKSVNTYFSKFFGYSSRSITVTAVGQQGASGPAVYAKSVACPVPGVTIGIQLNGSVSVYGDLLSAGGIGLYGSYTSNGYTQDYQTPCTCSGCSVGAGTSGPPIGFPTYTTASFTCGNGTSYATMTTLNLGGALNGTYCNGGPINVSGNNISGTATFVSSTGTVTISGTTVTISAAASNGIIIYAGAASNCYTNQTVNVGSSGVLLTGSIYAPNGCINTSGSTVEIDGSLYGNEVQLGSSNGIINPTGSSGSNYDLYQ